MALIENKRSLLRFPTPAGKGVWYHANRKDKLTLRLRQIPFEDSGEQFDDMTLDELNKHSGWKQFTFQDAGQMINLPVERFSVGEPTAWCLVAERMERKIHQPYTKANTKAKIIPITPLRHFYEWLNDRPTHVKKEFLHESLADSFLRDSQKLVDLFLTSCENFELYDNQKEGFVEGRDEDKFLASERFGTDPLVKQLKSQGEVSLTTEKGEIVFHYVDREVGLRRSTKETGPWLFEDGVPSDKSGAGGMDLLLLNKDNPGLCPVVGEIKVKRDQTPFFALIQVLTYATELCTPNQFARLRCHYPAFKGLPESPCAELLLLFSDLPDDYLPILNTTQNLVAEMYRRQPSFGKTIRRVTFMMATLNASRMECECLGTYGNST